VGVGRDVDALLAAGSWSTRTVTMARPPLLPRRLDRRAGVASIVAAAALTMAAGLGGAGCGKRRPARPPAITPSATGATADAAIGASDAAEIAAAVDAGVAAPALRPDARVPVLAIAGRAYIKLTAWAALRSPDTDELERWGAGPVAFHLLPTNDSRGLRLQTATAAPPAWRALIGTPVPAYQADGTACPMTITGLTVAAIAYPPSDEMKLNGDLDVVLAELGPAPGAAGAACTPVLVTARAPVFHPPRPAGPAAVARAVTAAFMRLPAYRDQRREWDGARPRLHWFAGPGDAALVVAEVDGSHGLDDCQVWTTGLWAVYEIAAGPPRLRGLGDNPYAGAPVLALYAPSGGADLEAILGTGRRSISSDGATGLVTLADLSLPAAAPAPAAGAGAGAAADGAAAAAADEVDEDADPDLDLPYYVGCD